MTKKKEKTTGRVEEVPEYVTRFIEKDLRGRIVTTHPDGHCVRRAIGKIWNLHPGQVIQYLATKCQKMLDQELTTQWERNVEWYEKTANRPREWGELKNNVPKQCKRDEWGGSSEINIWAIITRTIMVEINVDNETALIHYPDSYTTRGLNLRTQMQALKDMQATTHTKNPEYLIYGQNHYNAVWYNTKIKTKGNNKIKRKKENKQIKKNKIKTTQHKKEKRKVRGNERMRKKTKIDNKTQHKKT